MKSVYLAVLLFFSHGLFCTDTKVYVQQQLAQIPHNDRDVLRLYFETLLAQNFAYTLFGDKPVSEDGYYAPLYGDNSMKCALLRQGKEVWLKFHHLFTGQKFVFLYQRRGDFEDVYLINKKAVLDTVRMHLEEFRKVLGDHITPEILLEQLMRSDVQYYDVLHHHGGLVGLLYGFGHANAFHFYRLQLLETSIEKWFYPPLSFLDEKLAGDELEEICQDPFGYFRNALKDPQNSISAMIPAELRSLFSEYELYRNGMHDFPGDEDALSLSTLCLFPLPCFGANFDHPETAALKENYIKTRLNIIQEYSQGDFLEVILCKLLEK